MSWFSPRQDCLRVSSIRTQALASIAAQGTPMGGYCNRVYCINTHNLLKINMLELPTLHPYLYLPSCQDTHKSSVHYTLYPLWSWSVDENLWQTSKHSSFRAVVTVVPLLISWKTRLKRAILLWTAHEECRTSSPELHISRTENDAIIMASEVSTLQKSSSQCAA